MRGIIVTPPFEMKGDSFNLIDSNIDPIKLRQYLLYWDKIDVPDNNIVSVGGDTNVEYLMRAGILTRSRVTFNSWSGNVGYAFAIMQAKTLENYNKTEEGKWSIAQTNKKLILPQDLSIETRSIEVELYNSIPVPTSEVTLEDILKFKERRKDELLSFRALMDEMYLDIASSGDIPRAKLKCIENVQNSIIELNRVMDESKIKRFMGSVKIDTNIPNAMIKTAILGAVGSAVGFQFNLFWGATMLMSAINFKFENVLKPKSIPANLSDYAYLYYAHTEL